MKRRVVVTGLGAVTPIGNSVQDFWTSVKKGTVGIGEITKFDTADYKVKLAAEVKGFDAKEHMDARAARRMEPFSQYAVAAALTLRTFDTAIRLEMIDTIPRINTGSRIIIFVLKRPCLSIIRVPLPFVFRHQSAAEPVIPSTSRSISS